MPVFSASTKSLPEQEEKENRVISWILPLMFGLYDAMSLWKHFKWIFSSSWRKIQDYFPLMGKKNIFFKAVFCCLFQRFNTESFMDVKDLELLAIRYLRRTNISPLSFKLVSHISQKLTHRTESMFLRLFRVRRSCDTQNTQTSEVGLFAWTVNLFCTEEEKNKLIVWLQHFWKILVLKATRNEANTIDWVSATCF